jgi:shikimate dehydrogenase
MENIYGLIGKNLAYSFSRDYFGQKFISEAIHDSEYVNFDLADISQFPTIIKENPDLKGLNVTIPYKESIIPYLDSLSDIAGKIGAVNTIRIHKNGRLEGFNTDYYGFQKSLQPLLKPHHKKALILGTGGASKAVAFALQVLGISYQFVSRKQGENTIGYDALTQGVFDGYHLIINTTPLGTFPNVDECPDLWYELFTPNHIAFDLVYNPEETCFLKKAKSHGAVTKNGLEMLEFQAEKAWEIWS